MILFLLLTELICSFCRSRLALLDVAPVWRLPPPHRQDRFPFTYASPLPLYLAPLFTGYPFPLFCGVAMLVQVPSIKSPTPYRGALSSDRVHWLQC